MLVRRGPLERIGSGDRGARATTRARGLQQRTPQWLSPCNGCPSSAAGGGGGGCAAATTAAFWQGRWVARVAGRQNVATPAGSRVATKRTGSLFEPKISITFLLVGPDPVITRSSILLKHNSCQHLVEMCIYIHALIYSLILQSKLIFLNTSHVLKAPRRRPALGVLDRFADPDEAGGLAK